MSGVLLKKKKKVISHNKHLAPRVWVTRWPSREVRKFKKKTTCGKNVNIQRLKNKTSSHKKYKLFKKKIRPTDSIRKSGDGLAARGMIGFRCLKACKLNFSTMIGIKKKSEILKKNVRVWFRKYPTLLLTRKSTGHRMGKGKGKFSARIAKYKKGEIILEISYLDQGVFDNYYKAIVKTLPVKVEPVVRSEAFLKVSLEASAGVKNYKRTFR